MAEKLTLVVRFRIEESAKPEFLAKLQDVFTPTTKEETFLTASLIQDMRDAESILNYEVWNETPETFMQNQMNKPYRAEFEKMVVDLRIDRTPAWYSSPHRLEQTLSRLGRGREQKTLLITGTLIGVVILSMPTMGDPHTAGFFLQTFFISLVEAFASARCGSSV